MKKWTVGFCLLGHLGDVVTTMLPGGFEQNPLMRDANQVPVLSHVLLVKGFYLLLITLSTWFGYLQVKRVSDWFADALVVGVALYLAYDIWPIVLGNFMLYIKWVN
jgi:integral membrane sensor domain MASE1